MATNNFDKRKEFSLVAVIHNTGLLVTHIMLLLLFHFLHVTPMFYFNIASVIFYIISYSLLGKYIQLYLIVMLTEILVHLVSATVCIGWDAGFPTYSFGVISVIYYTKYIYIRKTLMRYIPFLVTVCSVGTYIALRIYSHLVPPLYPQDPNVLLYCFLANSFLIFVFIFISLHDYTKVVIKSEDKLHQIADYDELTQVYTRRKIHDILADYHAKAEQGRLNFCITIVDVDNFKKINDSFGHDAGDFVLKSICQKIGDIIKEEKKELSTDIARWGGDEFLIVQKYAPVNPEDEKATVDECKHTIQRLHDLTLAKQYTYDGNILPVGMTCGFAAHVKGDTITETFKNADEKLYKGKLMGKNVVIF